MGISFSVPGNVADQNQTALEETFSNQFSCHLPLCALHVQIAPASVYLDVEVKVKGDASLQTDRTDIFVANASAILSDTLGIILEGVASKSSSEIAIAQEVAPPPPPSRKKWRRRLAASATKPPEINTTTQGTAMPSATRMIVCILSLATALAVVRTVTHRLKRYRYTATDAREE